MRLSAKIASLCSLLFSLCISAQEIQDPAHKNPARSFHYTYDNDMFAGTDRYYTQGSIVEFRHPMFRKSPIAKLFKWMRLGRVMEHAIVFRQDVFTPKSIRNTVLDTNDRPYAGSFYFSQKAITKSEWTKLTASIDLGCMGPAALGEQMQKFIHQFGGNAEPLGWENQVANSFIANLNLWCENDFISTGWFDLFGQVGGKAGILHTNASAGLMMRAGKMNSYLEMFDSKPLSSWELYTTFSGTATYVAHNAMLQGVPWTKSTHVITKDKIRRLVYRLDAGLTLSIKNMSFTYTQSFLTPEFKGGWHHSWGGGNVVYRF